MARIKLEPGIRYVYRQQMWRIHQHLTDEDYQVENLSSGKTERIRYADILAAWSNGQLRFEVKSANAVSSADIPLKTRYTEEDLGSLPEERQVETWRRYQLVLDVYQYCQTSRLCMLSRQQIANYVQAHPASP